MLIWYSLVRDQKSEALFLLRGGKYTVNSEKC